MNDKGKTIKEIRNISPAYRRVAKRKGIPEYRCIELSMRLVLTGDKTEPAGYEGTMRLISDVSERAIKALAEEFLP